MNPSLYEMLTFSFENDLDIRQVDERQQVILSVLDNMQRILNSRAGAMSHLPDYGLPDLSHILQGLPASAHSLVSVLQSTLLKYEPRLKSVSVELLPDIAPAHLAYEIHAELKGIGLVRYGSAFAPEGRVMLRHLKQQGRLG
ncbi:type VI secretion system baseplate subunit TssE [Pectobacterium sp. B1J-3]|uniref:type VI secretion system baseplate subunit TssE n=1 Tax=Pectobacterium sp. B1J-3 TaxID=3385371 RepID=UPI00390637B0